MTNHCFQAVSRTNNVLRDINFHLKVLSGSNGSSAVIFTTSSNKRRFDMLISFPPTKSLDEGMGS